MDNGVVVWGFAMIALLLWGRRRLGDGVRFLPPYDVLPYGVLLFYVFFLLSHMSRHQVVTGVVTCSHMSRHHVVTCSHSK
jgi:uncharacterized membrane protein (GlpM family)